MTDSEQWVNRGVLGRPGPALDPDDGATIIVSGAGRGGTTMVASVLRAAGIPMGEQYFEPAVEDKIALVVLRQRNRGPMIDFIASRNNSFKVWGFKAPNIHGLLKAEELLLFRNPRLILTFRDPLAIAVRRTMSDHSPPLPMAEDALAMMSGILEFYKQTSCPALLISYEKAILKPGIFVDSILAFCGLEPRPDTRQRMLEAVNPNSEVYARGTTVRVIGYIDAIRDNHLIGWCALFGLLDIVELDLFVGDRKVKTFHAGQHRPDVLAAGFGTGDHGFAIDLTDLGLQPDDRLRVKLTKRPLAELTNSGKTVEEFRKLA